MFRRLLRWQFWRWRYREMRRRAVLAERALKAEMWRNREREDTLITVPMRAQGLWGMPARTEAAMKRVAAPQRSLTASTDPWDTLTWADKQEFELEWKQAAEDAGIPMQEAKRRFLAEVVMPRRMPLNDDPFAGAN